MQNITYDNEVPGFDLSVAVKQTMEYFKITNDAGIQIDYWSKMSQAFIICGSFNTDRKNFLHEDELILKEGG